MEVCPVVMVKGLKEAEQVGEAATPEPVKFTAVAVPVTPPVLE
ncbi:MAG: hypothetical protein M0Z71_00005 [Nitrospiraceae bacterium]|nr:hypothetical protein [Nitrospiraceae bacterium]